MTPSIVLFAVMLYSCTAQDVLYLCESDFPLANGLYRRQEEYVHDETHAYLKDEHDEHDESDYRLFRNHGYWMIANFEKHPPNTIVRCDPYKNTQCSRYAKSPPLKGYTSANESNPTTLMLQLSPCQADEL